MDSKINSPQAMTEIKSPMGKFWCHSHLADMPLSEQSADPRYCRQCYLILREEAKSGGHGSWWVPATCLAGSPDGTALTGGTVSANPSLNHSRENVTLILCQQCGKPMPYRRNSKKYCGFRCRKARQREKQKASQV